MTRQEKFLLFVLAAVQFTHIMDFMIVMPLGPQLMRLFSIEPHQFSAVVSAYTFSAGLFGFAGAFFLDRFDRRTALLWLSVGFATGTLLCALAPNYELLLIARAATGAFGGILGALVLAIVGDVFPLERRASAMGIVMAAFSVASVFGVPFGLYLASAFSWHAPFLFLGGVGALLIGAIVVWVPSLRGHLVGGEVAAQRKNPLRVVTNVAGSPNQLRALLFMLLLMMGQFTIIPLLATYMVRNVGFSEAQLTLIYLCGGALTIFTSPLIGRWADRTGHRRVFTVFMLINLVPLLLVTHLPPTHVALVLTITTLFFVCGGGRMIPAMSMITATVLPQNRGSFMSINASVQQLSAGLAAYVAGLIVTERADGSLLHYDVVGYLAVACTLAAIWAGRRLRTVEEVPAAPAGVAAARNPTAGGVVAAAAPDKT